MCRDTVPGSSGPAFSLAARPSSPQTGSGNLVGPGTYYNPAAEAAAHGGQAFTIGARLEQEKQKAGQDSPGPGSYKILEEPTGPAITMGSRPEPRGEPGRFKVSMLCCELLLAAY